MKNNDETQAKRVLALENGVFAKEGDYKVQISPPQLAKSLSFCRKGPVRAPL